MQNIMVVLGVGGGGRLVLIASRKKFKILMRGENNEEESRGKKGENCIKNGENSLKKSIFMSYKNFLGPALLIYERQGKEFISKVGRD